MPKKFNSNTLRVDFERVLLEEKVKHRNLFPCGYPRFNTQQRCIYWGGITIVYMGRSHPFLTQHPNQFTLQCVASHGRQSRYMKVMNGWGDYLLYGFQSPKDPKKVERCCLLDLRVFRKCVLDGTVLPSHHDNHDGTEFLAFHLLDFPASMVVFSTHEIHDDREALEVAS